MAFPGRRREHCANGCGTYLGPGRAVIEINGERWCEGCAREELQRMGDAAFEQRMIALEASTTELVWQDREMAWQYELQAKDGGHALATSTEGYRTRPEAERGLSESKERVVNAQLGSDGVASTGA